MNVVILQGRFVANPENKPFIVNETSVAKTEVTLAVKDGIDTNKSPKTVFVKCVATGKLAETIVKYCKKGQLISVEGKIRVESWTDKTTQKQTSKTLVAITQIHFCDSKKD